MRHYNLIPRSEFFEAKGAFDKLDKVCAPDVRQRPHPVEGGGERAFRYTDTDPPLLQRALDFRAGG